MSFERDDYSADSDLRHEEKVRRIGQPVRRAKASRRRITSKGSKAPTSPGGIRQRRNKRWNW